jgi:uncharacterized metal-binding protein
LCSVSHLDGVPGWARSVFDLNQPQLCGAADDLRMRQVVRAVPVLYPCPGCPKGGGAAREAARLLDKRRVAEMSGMNEIGLAKAKARFPVFAIDGCSTACARIWLERHGVAPNRSYVLQELELQDADKAAERIAADWR